MTTPELCRDPLFAQSALPMAKVALDGDVLAVNDALCRLFRRTAAEIVGRPSLDLCASHGGRTEAERLLAEGRDGGRSTARLVMELQLGEGQSWSTTLDCSLVRDGAGQPSYVAVVLVDAPADPTLERPPSSERRWRALLADAADVTWTADAAGVISDVTSGVRLRFGWDDSDVIGRSVDEFVHGDDVVTFRRSWNRVASGQVAQDWVEYRLRRRDGSWRWVRATLTDQLDEPSVRAVVSNVVDVTARRELEQARLRQEARMRARFAQSHLAMADVDLCGNLSDVNDAFTRLVGQARAELLGRSAVGLLHPDGSNGEALARVLAGDLDAVRVQRLLTAKDGPPRPVLVDVALLRDAEGRPDGAALIVLDLSRVHETERRMRQQSDFFEALSQRSTDAALVGDADGQILYASPSVGTVLGYEPADVVTDAGRNYVHPDDLARVRAEYDDVLRDGGSRTFLVRVRAADGRWLWIDETITNLLHTSVGGVVANLRDVTERVVAEQALRDSEALYRAIADTAEEGIWTVGADRRTTYVNGKMAEILGLSVDELLARDPTSLLDAAQAAQVRERVAHRSERGTERYEVTYAHPDGRERTLLVVASPLPEAEGGSGGSLAMVSDVTETRRAEDDLRRAALHDALTGLPNRSLLLDRLEHALAKQAASGTGCTALLFLDLDQFKLVNDSRGHELGDRLLVAVTERLLAHSRPEDTVARFGGDEFVVVCEQLDQAQAHEMAETLLAAVSEPFEIDGEVLHTSASVGIACSPPVCGGDLLRYADAAMYTAKGAGRGRARSFDQGLAEQVDRRYALGVDLRTALATGQLALHYQPVIELETGAVVGMEALARWDHPEHGSIPPTQFVAIADQLGLAGELDTWALRTAARDAAELRRAGRIPADAYVAVNLSARTVTAPGLETTATAAASVAGVDPGHIVLELTESAVMDDAERAVQVLGRMRERGFGVAIDDFGTGYSSLAYLKALPMSMLKIDRSFVADIDADADALAIVASIVDLARAVGVTTVAEGVETPQQLALLRRLGCTSAQGWLWSPAVPVSELLRPGGHDWCDRQSTSSADPAPVGALTPRTREPQPEIRAEHGLDRLLALHREGASLVTIAAALNREGYRTPTSARWHRTSVARAVAQAAYPDLAGAPGDAPPGGA